MDTPEITQSNRQPGKFGVHFIPKTSFTSIDFILPPSKSHLIRILALASIVEQKTSIIIDGPVGHDVNSMIQCLRTLGVEIISKTSFGRKMLEIQGIGKNAFLPNKTINCGNSGTALRILMNMVSSISGKTMIIGDKSLSHRDNEALKQSLIKTGVSIVEKSSQNLPIEVIGPWFNDSSNIQSIDLDISKSSQPLTAWLMSSSLLSSELLLQLSEEKVSNKHYQLSKSLCEKYGAYIEQSGNTIKLQPYDLSIPSRVFIPGDASMIGFAVLFSVLHKCVVNLSNCPNENDFLGCEILREKANLIGISWDDNAITPSHNGSFSTYDLTDCNDLITPMAITLAVSNGGILSGISHTRYKESNRLEKTIQLMNDFGIEAIMSDDVMIIQGGQTPKSPKSAIETYHDHRIYMSAVALLTLIGGELKGLGLHEIADPNFMSRLGIAC